MEKKYSFEEKTTEQLIKECNEALKNSTQGSTIEDEIEDEAAGGYDYYEDEGIQLTREIVHSHGEIPPVVEYREGYFKDGVSYVAESWYQELTHLITYYFSVEERDDYELEEYLVKMGKLQEGEEHHLKIMTIDSYVGELWSITVAVSDEDEEEPFCHAEL